MENNTYDRIIDYLSKSMSANQNLLFEQWIAQRDENKQLFDEVSRHWNRTKEISSQEKRAAWNKLYQNIRATIPKSLIIRQIAVAASLVLMVSATWFFYVINKPSVSFSTDAQTFLRDTLDDGSIIYLYPSSSLQLVKNHNEIRLTGEAFFVIPPQKQDKLIIRIGDSSIKVKGTSFRVKSGLSMGDVSILVESGEIEFWESTMRKSPLLVFAGEEAIYSFKNNTVLKKPKNEEIYVIYQPRPIH